MTTAHVPPAENNDAHTATCLEIAHFMDQLSPEEMSALGIRAAAHWLGTAEVLTPAFTNPPFLSLARILAAPSPSFAKQVVNYELLGRLVPPALMPCFNHGYYGGAKSATDVESLQYALYSRALADVSLKNATILELGCGRGFGTGFLAQTTRLASIVGVDPVVGSIHRAMEAFGSCDTITFHHGFADQEWPSWCQPDIVLSIEAAHGFGPDAEWLANNVRRLSPGTCICLTDAVRVREYDALRTMRQKLLVEEAFKEITPEVIESLTYIVSALNSNGSPVVRALLGQRLGLRLEQYRNGSLKYISALYSSR